MPLHAAGPGGTPRRASVLVADDDRGVRRSLGELVALSGRPVVEAEDGEQVLEALHHGDVGVVVLDLRMPRCDGWQVLERMPGPLPVVVVCSAHEYRPATPGPMGAARVYAALQKPVPPDEMLRVVDRALAEAERLAT